MGRRRSSTWYTVYEAYQDKLVVIGSALECAAYLGCSVNSFQSMVSKVKSGRNRSYCVVVEDLEAGTYAVYGGENTGELRGRHCSFDDSYAGDLYAAGYNDTDIGRMLSVDPRTIWKWRKNNGLPSVSRGRPRKALA